jgi:hypothetical protein
LQEGENIHAPGDLVQSGKRIPGERKIFSFDHAHPD